MTEAREIYNAAGVLLRIGARIPGISASGISP